MTRQLFTAADIRRLARGQKSGLLVSSSQDLTTPEAVDVARDLGVRLVDESPGPGEAAAMSGAPIVHLSVSLPLPGLKAILGGSVVLDSFGESLAAPGMNVRIVHVAFPANWNEER